MVFKSHSIEGSKKIWEIYLTARALEKSFLELEKPLITTMQRGFTLLLKLVPVSFFLSIPTERLRNELSS
jgi:hypothetical protein